MTQSCLARNPLWLRLLGLAALALLTLACPSTDTAEAPPEEEAAPPPPPEPQLASLSLGHTGITRGLDGTPVAGEYTTMIQVGTPPRDFEVVMDSGSSNLILLGDSSLCNNCSEEKGNQYAPSQSSTGKVGDTPIQIRYGSGQLDAVEARDQVAIAGMEPFQYTFGVMTHDANVPNILGLAYEGIAEPQGQPLPTFFATLVEQTGIADVFAMKLCGPEKGGTIEFGGSSETPSAYMPVVEEAWYVVEPDHLGIAGSDANLGSFEGVKTIVDSGTTELVVTDEMFQGIVDAVGKAAQAEGIAFDQIRQGVYGIEGDIGDLSRMPIFQVVAGGNFYEIGPGSYFKLVSEDDGKDVFMLAVSPSNQAILGQVFMENFYTVFDRANRRVGFTSIGDLCD